MCELFMFIVLIFLITDNHAEITFLKLKTVVLYVHTYSWQLIIFTLFKSRCELKLFSFNNYERYVTKFY